MHGFIDDIETLTLENDDFRKVLYTGKNIQLVLMTIPVKEDIGEETHEVDQFFRIEAGKGIVKIDDNLEPVEDGDAVIVPAGAKHNVLNTGNVPLRVYTIYGPPHHKDGIVFKTKADAEKSTEEFDGKTTEK